MVEAGALTSSVQTARNMDFFGTLSAHRATIERAAASARQTALKRWPTQAHSARKKVTLVRILILWSAQKAKSKKGSSATSSVARASLALTMSAGVGAHSAQNSVVYSACATAKHAQHTLQALAKIPLPLPWPNQGLWVVLTDLKMA